MSSPVEQARAKMSAAVRHACTTVHALPDSLIIKLVDEGFTTTDLWRHIGDVRAEIMYNCRSIFGVSDQDAAGKKR